MSIRLLDRIATLVRADAHGLVESLEERSLLLKQYVREAEIDLNRKRARLEALREEEKRLRDAARQREAECAALDEDVTLAMAGGKDDLARFAIRRLLPRRKEIEALSAQLAVRAAEMKALAERVEQQQAQFEALRTRVRVELTQGVESAPPVPWTAGAVVADEDVEIELLRRRRAAEGGR